MHENKSYVPSWQEDSHTSRLDQKLRNSSTESTPNSTPILTRQHRRRKQSENIDDEFSSSSENETSKIKSPETTPKMRTRTRPLARRTSNIKVSPEDNIWQLT